MATSGRRGRLTRRAVLGLGAGALALGGGAAVANLAGVPPAPVGPDVNALFGMRSSTGHRYADLPGRAGRVDARVARIFNTYGPRMRADDGRVVSNVVTQALAGDDITVYGEGRQTRSFCYVSDLIEGLLRLMAHESRLPGAVNLGNPVELTVGELVRRVLALTGSNSAVVNRPLPEDDPRRRRPDIGRAEALLGWTPRTPLETGLRATIAWFSGDARSPAARSGAAASEPSACSTWPRATTRA